MRKVSTLKKGVVEAVEGIVVVEVAAVEGIVVVEVAAVEGIVVVEVVVVEDTPLADIGLIEVLDMEEDLAVGTLFIDGSAIGIFI